MNRPRLIRWLRITASAVCLVVCGLLVALWVRSYWRLDGIRGPLSSTKQLYIASSMGKFAVRVVDADPTIHWGVKSIKRLGKDRLRAMGRVAVVDNRKFGFKGDDFLIPHWLLMLPFAALGTLAAIPWICWRFSIKTMLIVTAVVAVILGIIVWLTR